MEKEKINPHVEELFTVMHEIDERVKMVKKEAIMLVGLTRVGKSTCYNWALNHPLKSEKEIIRKIYKGVERVTEGSVIYLPEVKLTDSAEVQPGFKSCTQVPNIIDLNPDISLIDTAGFGDSRNYVGTLAVSYSLKAIFEAVDKVKFIIVLNESKLESRTDLCNTFNHFLSMFNF
jgi:tRNA U34 5-carboxymethylaminomethyl modifying GTPase MnmE/TrmE